MALSPDQALYATVTSQSSNRIRLFDTKTSQLKFTLVDNNASRNGIGGHENGSLLAHVSDSNDSTSGGTSHYLVSANKHRTSSNFTIWDVTRGVAAHHVNLPDEFIILDITSSCSAAFMYVLGADIQGKVVVFQYQTAKGKLVRKIKTGAEIDISNDDSAGKLCLSTNGSVLAVCTAISGVRIIDVDSGKRIRKLKPRSVMGNEPTLLVFADNESTYLMCAVKNSNAAYILSCSASEDEKSRVNHAILAVDSVPIHMQMMLRNNINSSEDMSESTPDQVIVVVSTKSGSVALFEVPLSAIESPSNPEHVPSVTVSCESKDDKVDALSASFLASSPQQKLLIARHSASAPSFEVVLYRDGGRGGVVKKSLVLASKEDGADIKSSSKKRSSTEVLGPGEVGTGAIVQDAEQNKKRMKTGDDTAELIDESDLVDEGPSIAERINALTKSSSDDENHEQSRKAPSTKGVVVILRQSLASSNSKQLEIALQCHDHNVVENTITQLTGNEVIDLLGELVHRIATKPTRTESLALWLRTILSKHTNLLMNNTELANKLAPLRNLLNERVESLPNFLKLEGRLTMLASRK